MRISTTILQTVLFVLLPLAVGVLLYDWFSASSVFNIHKFELLKNVKPKWDGLVYNVPDGLWAFSLMSAMLIIWQGEKSGVKYLWIFLALCLAFGSEILQKLNILKGTFDWWDILAIGVGVLLSILMLFNWKR